MVNEYTIETEIDVEELMDINYMTLSFTFKTFVDKGSYWNPPSFDVELQKIELIRLSFYDEKTNETVDSSPNDTERWNAALDWIKENENSLFQDAYQFNDYE